MQKHEVQCRNCKGGGSMKDTQSGQIYPCGACGGSGAVNRPEVGPQDYVFEMVIPTGQTQAVVTKTILSYDFLAKWLVFVASDAADQVLVKDNTGYQWQDQPIQLQNWAGTGSLPFPLQPNVLIVKNATISITMTGTAGDTAEICLRGINLADVASA
jgi:hypothetical protein